MNPRLLIVEDQPIYVEGLRGILAQDPRLQVMGHAENGQAALDFLAHQTVDVVLLDINMPVLGGLETVPHLQAQHPDTQVIMLTVYDHTPMIMHLLELGVSGYLLKDSRGKEIRDAIHTVAAGGTHYGIEIMKKITQAMRTKQMAPSSPLRLSPRELEVLRLVVEEFTAQEIAERLFVSKETIDTHRKNIREKLGVRNTAGMVREALRQGLVSIEQL